MLQRNASSQKLLATLPEETVSGATSPAKTSPVKQQSASKSSRSDNSNTPGNIDLEAMAQRLESQHTETMQRASRKWQEEKAQLLEEIERFVPATSMQ